MNYFLFLTSILSTTIIIYTYAHKDVGKSKVGIKFPYEWNYVDFEWESEEKKQKAEKSGDYNARAIFLYNADKASDGRIFVGGYKTKGSPVGVATVSNKTGKGGPLLNPYPNWNWWSSDECKTGFYTVSITCNHLFVIHSGKYGNREKLCPAQLLIFDLSTDKLIKKIIVPSDIADNKNGSGLLTSSFVDAKNCWNIAYTATVYIADTEGYGLITYDAKTEKFCRIESDFMKPNDTMFYTKNENFTLTEGIYGLTKIKNELYFTVTSRKNIFKIEISKLRCPLSIDEANKAIKVVATQSGQIDAIASKNFTIFFDNIAESSILCADSRQINSTNTEILAQDTEKLLLPSTLIVRDNELLGTACNYHRYITDTHSTNKTNFLIFTMNIPEIQSKTTCFDSCSYNTTC